MWRRGCTVDFMSELFPTYRATWETDQHRELRKHAAEFLRKESTPNQERWAKNHQVDREFWNKMGDAGLLGLDLPEEFGGAGGDFGYSAVVAEELALAHDSASGWPVHSPIVAHYLNTYGNGEQRQRWMPKVISGEAVLAIAMTEPGTGSDLQAVRTTAIRDGDDYLINGSKTFISNGTHCDLLVIVAKTDPSQGASGISLIVAETDENLQGFERGRVLDKVGQHGQDTRELFFSDMRVPAANLLGEQEGLGFYQLMEQLARERLIIASLCAGMAEAALLEAIKYTKEREAFGKPLIKFQHNRFELAELKAEVLSIKTTVDFCIQQYIDGNNDPATASMGKLIAADKGCDVVDRCVQFFGGYGYMMEYPIARAYAAARVNKIYGGTSEIMKEIIGRSL
jgi:acyl-CoA dehydrogenase